MTIPVGLDSATISTGVATRRGCSPVAQDVPEMGDANQRSDDAVIQMGFGVAFLIGSQGRLSEIAC